MGVTMNNGGTAVKAPGDRTLSASVLVLNRNYAAIRIISARRAFILLYKDYAEAIDSWGEEFGTFDFAGWVEHSREQRLRSPDDAQFVTTPRLQIMIPRVIRLRRYDKVPRREVKFSRRNILARDDHACQYCGRRLSTSQLSIDHVVPKSRGGGSTWTNVVAACNQCNTRKGGRMPQEASMRLRCVPRPPRRNPLLAGKVHHHEYRLWRHFLSEAEMAVEA